eukprot:UN02285
MYGCWINYRFIIFLTKLDCCIVFSFYNSSCSKTW